MKLTFYVHDCWTIRIFRLEPEFFTFSAIRNLNLDPRFYFRCLWEHRQRKSPGTGERFLKADWLTDFSSLHYPRIRSGNAFFSKQYVSSSWHHYFAGKHGLIMLEHRLVFSRQRLLVNDYLKSSLTATNTLLMISILANFSRNKTRR